MKLLLALSVLALAAVGYSNAMNLCPGCCKLVAFVKSEEKREENAEMDALQAICSDLTHQSSGFEYGLCKTILDGVLHIAVNWFENDVSATKICHDAGHVCSGSETCPNTVRNPFQVAKGGASDLCAALKDVVNEIKSGAIDSLCTELHLDSIYPGICADIKGFEPQILKVAQMVTDLLCAGHLSEELLVAASNDVCADIKEVVQVLESGVVDKMCQEFLPGSSFCAALKGIESKLLSILKVIAADCGSSSYGQVLQVLGSQNPCEIIEEILRVLKSGEIDDLCKELGLPANDCAMLKQYEGIITKVLGEVAALLGCSSRSARPAILAASPLCSVLNQIDSAISSGELDNLCKEFVPAAQQAQVCGELKSVEASFEYVEKIIKPFLHC